mgnify:FL=1
MKRNQVVEAFTPPRCTAQRRPRWWEKVRDFLWDMDDMTAKDRYRCTRVQGHAILIKHEDTFRVRW